MKEKPKKVLCPYCGFDSIAISTRADRLICLECDVTFAWSERKVS